MTYKLNEIERVRGELGETRSALTELREQMDVLAARANAYEHQLDELQGVRRSVAAPLTDRIMALVGELGLTFRRCGPWAVSPWQVGGFRVGLGGGQSVATQGRSS